MIADLDVGESKGTFRALGIVATTRQTSQNKTSVGEGTGTVQQSVGVFKGPRV